MKIVVISDTHGEHAKLSGLTGDVLIHCGDFSLSYGEQEEAALHDLDTWFGQQNFTHVLCVGGNHDFGVEEKMIRGEQVFRNAVCLENQAVELDGIKFYGAPWVPELSKWAHFLTPLELTGAWAQIPDDVDVLITHTPPRGIRDRNSQGKECGCEQLRDRVRAIKPQLHCFGHIHASAGHERQEGTLYVNASLVNRRYEICRAPTTVSIERRTRV